MTTYRLDYAQDGHINHADFNLGGNVTLTQDGIQQMIQRFENDYPDAKVTTVRRIERS